MTITSVKIHPAIGVARLGNSPDDFFIGPERPWDVPDPPGGFKDAQCRVKRQAARFRVYAYHDTGAIVELTAASAEIRWTVRLANKKAVTRNAGTSTNLTIDPGARTLTGPDQRTLFDTGTVSLPGAAAVKVPLGEIRTDDDGHLLVLGGFGTSASPTNQLITNFLNNAGWYDDISDGPVNAHVKINATGTEFDAVGAWAIVAPPKFAPQIENVVTLYDRIFQVAVDQGWRTAPVTPSYTDDIFPILERARSMRWVFPVGGAHTWGDPVYTAANRQAIFDRLADPNTGAGGDMPRLNNATLTKTQFAAMEKWKDGNFTQDWVAAPAPAAQVTPAGLEQAALTACVGAAFFPGIEAGGIAGIPIVDPTNYVGAGDPMRLDHAQLSAGDVSEFMALPWQADFFACGYQWWPVPRPNNVIPVGESAYQAWNRDVGSMLEMVSEWHTLGFIVRQGTQYVEVDRCDTTFMALLTPHLDFQDVPQGPMGMARKAALAVAFEVRSPGGAVVLDVAAADAPAHPRLTLVASSVSVGPTAGNEIATARIWVRYETGAVNETLSDQLTVRHAASGASWTVTISANTVARKVAAVALVLDRSGSMLEDRGDGQSKYESLKEAASIFTDVMLEGDAVSVVRYNQDAQPLLGLTPLGAAGDPFDAGRQSAKTAIEGPGLVPTGATSIGDGIYEGRQVLNAAGSGYDVKSLVVLTDGKENSPRSIADVAAQINELTYAIGLGTPQNTSAPALQTISGNNGGYLLVTGAITGDKRFILSKYFLQILAGISNADVVLDPDGTLIPDQQQVIPFQLTEADAGIDVILLTPFPHAVDFRLQTPNGFLLEPWRAIAEPSMAWRLSDKLAYYRVVLPTELFTARYDQAGTWRVLLSIGRPRTTRPSDFDQRVDRRVGVSAMVELARRMPPPQEQGRGPEGIRPMAAQARAPQTRTLPFSVLVHTYSNLSFRASFRQSGFEPGTEIVLGATLAESGVPARPGAVVWTELTRPDSTTATIVMPEVEAGRFEGRFRTAASGVYRCRVRASGRSHSGYPFLREQTVTPTVWSGGDRVGDPNAGLGHWAEELDHRLCEFIQCLSDAALSPELERQLKRAGIDIARLRRCAKGLCRPRPSAAEEEARRAATASGSAGLGARARVSEEITREDDEQQRS